MRKILALVAISLLAACTVEPPQPTAFVSLAENAKAGGMKITAINGQSVEQADGHYIAPGKHQFSVACQLDNGIGTTFSFETDLLADHSYCFFSRDQGKSCTIVYTRVAWKGEGSVTCK